MGKIMTLAVAAFVAGSSTAAYAHTIQPPPNQVTCRRATGIPVAIAPGQPASCTVSGELCATDYPATHDPMFAGSGLDAGYLTTVPGTRTELFYSPPDVDPAVIASDEARKDVVPATELATCLPVVTSRATLAIRVPVLDILGSNDFTTCGPNQGGTFNCSSGAAVAAHEAPYYSPQAQIHACVVPGSGHDISLALNHQLQVEDAVAWSYTYVSHHLDEASDNDLPRNCG
jgi:hypothetical protein